MACHHHGHTVQIGLVLGEHNTSGKVQDLCLTQQIPAERKRPDMFNIAENVYVPGLHTSLLSPFFSLYYLLAASFLI